MAFFRLKSLLPSVYNEEDGRPALIPRLAASPAEDDTLTRPAGFIP
jgi:hypothetical protein